MDGITVIEAACQALIAADFGLKSNQWGGAVAAAVNAMDFEVRLEMLKDCDFTTAPAARNSKPLGETAGGAAVPAGTILRTIAIEIGGWMLSVGVMVTTP